MNPLAWVASKFRGEAMPAERLAEVIRLNDHRPRMSASATFSGSWGAYLHDGSKFSGGLPNTGASPVIDHQITRRNARESYHTAPVARAIVERFAETVVDAGLRLEPTPAFDVLGLTQREAGEWSRSVAARFHLWASSKFAHAAGQMTFYQLQRQAEIGQQRDGEYFVRCHYLETAGRPHPLALQLIEPEQITGSAYTTTQGYPWDTDGIKRDDLGREISYQIAIRRGQVWTTETVPAFLPNGRPVILHGWCSEYAAQSRGFSRLTHAIQEFEQLTKFTSAQIEKAIKQSALVMTKETDNGAVPSSSMFGDTAMNFAAEDGTPVAPEENTFGYEPMNVRLSPGGIGIFEGLNAGERIKAFDSTAPSDSFGAFTDAFIAHIAAASSIPVEIVMLRFNANYSASRAALVMFWRVAKLWRKELESDFLNPVWETWLAEEIAAGRISAPGWLDPIARLAWTSCEWSGSEMPNIDPEKSVNAARIAIEANLSNYQREARELNGSDAETNKALNQAFSVGMGPAPWTKAQTAPSAPSAPPADQPAHAEPDDDEVDDTDTGATK